MAETTTWQRRIEFEGAHNFRDLGGYDSTLGGTTRWGRVYRSDRLDALTPTDRELFDRLGIVTVYDLRNDDERADHPDPMPTVHAPVLSRFIANGPRPDFDALVEHDQGVRFMRDMCVAMLGHAGPEIGQVLTGLADLDRTPAVFHCTAGKDRTGVVAALLLEWLGVERETVIDDFELTARYHRPNEDSHAFQRMLARGIGPEAAAGALGAPRSMMADTLRELDETFGGIEAYLTGPAGIDGVTLDRLRESLLT